MRTYILLAILSLALLLSAGCSKKEGQPVASQPARVTATSSYEKYFGPAPTTDKGTCFAFVIFFPSAKNPGKIMPLPFFTFDKASLKKVAVERLFGGMDVGSYQGEFLSLPPGTRINKFNESNGAITVTLSSQFNSTKGKTADSMASAIAATLRQFKGVTAVRIMIEGSEAPINIPAGDDAIMPPGPPRMLSLTAMKDKGAKNVEEVNAFFDRPVEIKELKLLSKDGQPYRGDIYHSVFDMAAVLKPKDPSIFTERMPIKVHWKVTDRLGGQAEGDNVWFLEVKEH